MIGVLELAGAGSGGLSIAGIAPRALTRFVFARYANSIRTHRRYIDDGLIIWRGTAVAAAALFHDLNGICPDIQLTFEISQTKAIFLDLVIFKGKRWQSTGHLDTKCYQK
eukprot:SAG31_NODE_12209_length_958_cov_7.876601_1_plen_109_part_10